MAPRNFPTIREVLDPDFNREYRIELGQSTFEMLAEDLAAPMRVSAASVGLEIHHQTR